MILHFSFRTTEFEEEYDDIDNLLDGLKNIHKLNSCDYWEKEILIYHDVMIPGLVYTGKVFYDIIFDEDPKNVFVEVYNDTDPKMLTGVSKEGIELFNKFNSVPRSPVIMLNKQNIYENRLSADKIFKYPENTNNELYGFCVDKIDFNQILEINIMYFNGKDSDMIKQIYKK